MTDESEASRRRGQVQPLRLGFIGAGEMANFSVYPSLYLADVELCAVCDLVAEKARLAARRFGARNWYTDYRQMWTREELDAVIIHMHPVSRQPLVLEALEAGYHVFVPKPPAPDLESARQLARASKRHDRILMVNFQRRFSYGVRTALEILKRSSFGSLCQFSSSFCSGPYDERRARFYQDTVHAFLLDFAPHHLDLALYLCGPVTRMSAYHRTQDGGVALALAVAFESGAVGTLQLNSNRVWWRNYDRVEITGQGEYLVLDGLWSVKHYQGSGNYFTENYSDQRSSELTGDAYALSEFVEAIRENRRPTAGIEDTLNTMRLYQTLYRAVREGRQGTVFEQDESASGQSR